MKSIKDAISEKIAIQPKTHFGIIHFLQLTNNLRQF